MTDTAATINEAIRQASPALYELLSPLGRRVVYPNDIPFQAGEARGKTFNATIGQITDGADGAISVASVAAGLSGLDAAARNRALLYSPGPGFASLREAWRRRQRRGVAAEAVSGLPFVTVGLSHGLSMVADLFAGEGRTVVLPQPFWGNYRQAFSVRTGARLVGAPSVVGGRFHAESIAECLDALPEGEPAVAILNFPSNPGGYSPNGEERTRLCRSLVQSADRRPLLVLCDDAYAGLVFEDDIPRESLFWNLVEAHPNLIPVKVDGATKEVSFFGGRVGFVTFPFAAESAVGEALESKLKCLLRAVLGSPVAVSQQILVEALASPTIEEEVEKVRLALAERYQILKEALAATSRDLIVPMPFNSGCFALLELPAELGVSSEEVRQHLLAHHDTGVVSIAPRYIRIAFCSVSALAIPELVRRLELAIGELAETSAGVAGE
jgi:aspartate/methionine/tyrosine aminotransferase